MDRIKVLHDPRTQTYGETNYLTNLRFGQNQGIAWSSDSKLWGNQLLNKIYVMDRTKVLHDPRTQTYGETNCLIKSKFWTESRYCMVFGLKPMGKATT